MIDIGIIITGAIGLVSTIVTGWTSWFFARKKYNSEVDQNVIKNMSDSLEFYKSLSDDNKSRLDEMIKRNEYLEEEIEELRKQVLNLMTIMCTDLSCQLRKGDYKELLKDETHSKENV